MFGMFRKKMPGARLSYAESCKSMQPRHLERGQVPPLPDGMPQADDEVLGVSFFRTLLDEEDDLVNLTLPRTFFGRSEIKRSSFHNTDLTESNLCWNDFEDVNFTDAILVRADLRASSFTRVSFDTADLSNADLRQSNFEHCTFTNATMTGTVLTAEQGALLRLSAKQRAEIVWTEDDGPEPLGG